MVELYGPPHTKVWGVGVFKVSNELGIGWVQPPLGDDAQAVVYEIPEAIRASLNKLHLAVESLGDPVVAREALYADDRFDQVFEGVGNHVAVFRVMPMKDSAQALKIRSCLPMWSIS